MHEGQLGKPGARWKRDCIREWGMVMILASGRILPILSRLENSLRVCDLIYKQSCSWHKDLLEQLFNLQDCESICQILLAPNLIVDQILYDIILRMAGSQ